MSERIDTKDFKNIESLKDLKAKREALEQEVHEVGEKVTSSASDLLKQGAKVAAAGVAAVVISKMVGAFMRARKKVDEVLPDKEQEPSDPVETTASEAGEEESTNAGENESLAEKVRTLVMWLDALVKGIETAKILIHEFREQRNEYEGEDDDAEPNDTDMTDTESQSEDLSVDN